MKCERLTFFHIYKYHYFFSSFSFHKKLGLLSGKKYKTSLVHSFVNTKGLCIGVRGPHCFACESKPSQIYDNIPNELWVPKLHKKRQLLFLTNLFVPQWPSLSLSHSRPLLAQNHNTSRLFIHYICHINLHVILPLQLAQLYLFLLSCQTILQLPLTHTNRNFVWAFTAEIVFIPIRELNIYAS